MTIQPCPFCGFDDPYYDEMITEDESFFYLTCLECGAEGPIANSPAEAGEKWNGRIAC